MCRFLPGSGSLAHGYAQSRGEFKDMRPRLPMGTIPKSLGGM